MFSNFTPSKSITRLGAMSLIAAALFLLPVRAIQPQVESAIGVGKAITSARAQSSYTHPDLYKNIWINGFAQGETLRYTWANLNDPDPQKRVFEPLRILVKLLNADGSVVAQDEAAAVGAGRFQVFDFDVPGERGIRRGQWILDVTVTGETRYPHVILKQRILETFADALGVIDNSSGRTTVTFSGGRNGIILDDSSGNDN
jgi:hypothetical protein